MDEEYVRSLEIMENNFKSIKKNNELALKNLREISNSLQISGPRIFDVDVFDLEFTY
jgi:hypothetical protein